MTLRRPQQIILLVTVASAFGNAWTPGDSAPGVPGRLIATFERGPYVPVGHSLRVMVARLFATRTGSVTMKNRPGIEQPFDKLPPSAHLNAHAWALSQPTHYAGHFFNPACKSEITFIGSDPALTLRGRVSRKRRPSGVTS